MPLAKQIWDFFAIFQSFLLATIIFDDISEVDSNAKFHLAINWLKGQIM
jgi:hypothetical protein